jgi:hypothetical protein
MDLRLRSVPDLHPGKGVSKVFQKIRQLVPYQPGDALWNTELQKVRGLIDRKELEY